MTRGRAQLLRSEQINIEDQRGAWRDVATGAARTVAQVRRAHPVAQSLAIRSGFVSGCYQVGREAGSLDSSIARATEVADRLRPAEDFLDPLAHPLAERVFRPTVTATFHPVRTIYP